MSLSKIALCILSAAAAAATAARPRAAVAAPTAAIVVESYEGERPADADSLLKPVYDELTRRGFKAQDALIEVLDADVSHDGGQLTASQSAEAQKVVERGYQHFINGDYDKAIAAEQQALALYATAPATLAKEPALRELQFKANLIAARSAEVLGRTEDAFRLMAEAVRAIPDRPVNAAEFDPQVKALYRRVKDELTRQGPATLEVKVDDPTAVIFVDERFAGTGTVALDNLLPGQYRVLVARGEQLGRVHRIEVPGHGHATVDVAWALDGTLRTARGYVGLESRAGAGGAGEIELAVKLARAVAARTVVVLGIREIEGRRSVIAYSISAESQTKIYGAVQVEPITPPVATLIKLGALMAGDKVDVPGMITKEAPLRRGRHVIGTRPGALHTWKWVAAGGAVAGLATGAALIALDDKVAAGGARGAEYRHSKPLGVGIGLGGAALAAVAIYMFAADHDVEVEVEDARGVAIAPVVGRDGAGVVVMGRF
jgi:tetratricopeptide (TPR) repeat protein